jgi:hypothetical protein
MNVELNIQPEEELFYYYHNWQTDEENKIHLSTCRFCVYGSGRQHNREITRGENGVWIGPFSSLALCQGYVQDTLHLPPVSCQVCL